MRSGTPFPTASNGISLSLSLVVPLFNGEQNIRKVMVPILRVVDAFVQSYECSSSITALRTARVRRSKPCKKNFRKS